MQPLEKYTYEDYLLKWFYEKQIAVMSNDIVLWKRIKYTYLRRTKLSSHWSKKGTNDGNNQGNNYIFSTMWYTNMCYLFLTLNLPKL